MASVSINDYHIEYSIIDGKIHSFEKLNDAGKYVSVDDESKIIEIAELIIGMANDGHGYPAFVCKLIDDGKIKYGKEKVGS